VTDEHLVAIDLAQVGLRADPGALPFEPPAPNTATTWNDRDVLWLGPDEWLVVGDAGTESSTEGELRVALGSEHHSIVDVSANRVVFDLTDGLDPLSSGCGLDLDPRNWLPGMCAQSLFGQAQVILHQLDGRTTRVFVRPSFADYFVERLGVAQKVSRSWPASGSAMPRFLPPG
jgi:sarcosine oxidase subunit gamma